MNRSSLTRPRGPATEAPRPPDPANLNPSRWLARLVHRKYLELFEPAVAGQYSVRMANEGSGSYFLLGTTNETRAAARAEAIHRAATQKGWDFVHRHYSREFTLSVFWNDNPLLCTYA